MRAPRAPDHDLLADSLRGPSAQDAARSLAFWRGRRQRLPLRRLAARREARSMVIAWEERLRRAEIERNGGGLIGEALGALAVLRGERPAAVLRRTIGALVPRRVITTVVAVVLAAAVTLGVAVGVVIAGLVPS